MNVFDTLRERGLIAQMTHENEIRELLDKEKVTFYIGFDPTADSLHVGHFLQMIVMRHMQMAGHRPIAILGGGTTMVGDPTGKTDMRKMMTIEEINQNAENFKKQMSKFIDFSEGRALMINNADWLLKLNYIDFLREIGVHFSVNRMLTAECFKSRLEKGLTFIEFNYMLMQSYDFLKLYRDYGCRLELGGDDQWSNIIGGIELIRRVEAKEAYGMTFTLLTTSEGKKMGKTEKGAVWLDPNKTSPYDFYQYWRNVEDDDVLKCLKLITFVPMETINAFEDKIGSELNEAKKLLAFELTKLVHGESEAENARDASAALFEGGANIENMPTVTLDVSLFESGLNILDLLVISELAPSKAEARRLVQQGGISVDNNKIEAFDAVVTKKQFSEGHIMIKKGKKVYLRVVISEV